MILQNVPNEVIRVLGNIEASSGGQDKLTNEIKEVTNLIEATFHDSHSVSS